MLRPCNAHLENGTWELVRLSPGCGALGSKWVFKVKWTADGTYEHHKAHVVAQGFNQ